MPNKINLMCVGGPYGDSTSAYKFTIPTQMTLKEFAEMVAADGEEWGSIRKGGPFGDVLVDYKHGEIKYRDYADPNAILKTEGTANGGWSLMDYYVEIDQAAELHKVQEQYNQFLSNNEPTPSEGLMGWICPVCGRGLSPYTTFCPCTGNWEITYGTGTTVPSSETITCQDTPAANVAPVTYGKWIEDPYAEKCGDAYCSECNHFDWSNLKYCPNCGAKMEGDNK